MVHGVQNGQPVAASNLPHAGSVPLYTLFFQGGVSVHCPFKIVCAFDSTLAHTPCCNMLSSTPHCIFNAEAVDMPGTRARAPSGGCGAPAGTFCRLIFDDFVYDRLACPLFLLSVPGTDTVRCSPARGLRAREREGEVEPTPNSALNTERLPPATAPPFLFNDF